MVGFSQTCTTEGGVANKKSDCGALLRDCKTHTGAGGAMGV